MNLGENIVQTLLDSGNQFFAVSVTLFNNLYGDVNTEKTLCLQARAANEQPMAVLKQCWILVSLTNVQMLLLVRVMPLIQTGEN